MVMSFEQYVAHRFNELNGPLFVWDMLSDADKTKWRKTLLSAYELYKFTSQTRQIGD